MIWREILNSRARPALRAAPAAARVMVCVAVAGLAVIVVCVPRISSTALTSRVAHLALRA